MNIPEGYRELEHHEWVVESDLCWRRGEGPWTAIKDMANTYHKLPYRYERIGTSLFTHIRKVDEPYALDPVHFREQVKQPGKYYITTHRSGTRSSGPYESEAEALTAIEKMKQMEPMWDYGMPTINITQA